MLTEDIIDPITEKSGKRMDRKCKREKEYKIQDEQL